MVIVIHEKFAGEFIDTGFLLIIMLVIPINILGTFIVRTPPFTRGGIDILRFGNKGGGKIFFLEREGLDYRGGRGGCLERGGDSSLLYQIFIKKRNIKMIFNLFEFSNHFLKFQNIKSEPHLYW